jgi:hypothetical protein
VLQLTALSNNQSFCRKKKKKTIQRARKKISKTDPVPDVINEIITVSIL